MRIISSFHDYYDSIQAYGQDPSLIYRRECEKVKIPKSIDSRLLAVVRDWYGRPEDARRFRLLIVGFCGKAYPVYLDAETKWDASDLTTHRGLEAVPYDSYFNHLKECDYSEKDIEHLKEGLAGVPIGDSLFIACRAPVFFLFTSQRWWWGPQPDMELYTNPRLSNVNFASLVDPFTAYQEIAMFLGSQLAVEDKAPRTVGDDKIIAASKGFDEQSFITNVAGEKELKRKANRARKRGQ